MAAALLSTKEGNYLSLDVNVALYALLLVYKLHTAMAVSDNHHLDLHSNN